MNRLDLIESHAADVAELAERLDHAGDADGFARALASFIELAGWKHSGAGRWHRARRSHHRGPVPPHRRAGDRSLPAASPEPVGVRLTRARCTRTFPGHATRSVAGVETKGPVLRGLFVWAVLGSNQ